ncbi:hypothetical protein PYCCODRAFT_1449007 [Trametes coccinea BRFM310]|uniref:F-box domain-containing protein n=1 Tax=Trametes coccinea (strain BRFM310) TaxID=1353009 RepID=A0A1Y2J357_TRAC3|nr:hypothetical protein PYCCODRAFT_1449007 [Trametes coccinea BRFM310]
MTSAGLPIELLELAIDFLEDEQSLKATSLVCKAWLPRSRLNLFRTIELCLPGHLDHFATLLTESPHIAPYVEALDISENSLLAVFRPSKAIVARFPRIVASCALVQLRRLTIHHQLWLPTRYSPDYLQFLSRLSSITTLHLYDVTFTSIADFSLVLRAFERLTSLSAKHLDCQRQLDSAIAADIGCSLPLLTKLSVDATHPTSVIDWLLRHTQLPAICDVECSYELSTNDRSQGLGAFWSNSGGTLERLSLSITKRSAGARFPVEVIEQQLDLSPCRELRMLRLDCRHERGVAPDWSWLTWLLSHIRRRTLRKVVFDFQSSSHAIASLHAFAEEVDGILTSDPFSHILESVIFKFDFRDAREPDDKCFTDLFPRLRVRNLLRVIESVPYAFI